MSKRSQVYLSTGRLSIYTKPPREPLSQHQWEVASVYSGVPVEQLTEERVWDILVQRKAARLRCSR